MTPQQIDYVVQPTDDGMRLDALVVQLLGGRVPRTQVRKLFESQAVRVAERVAIKSWRARPGDTLSIAVASSSTTPAPAHDVQLRVCLERDDLVVVDKPSGMPTAPIDPRETGTLVNGLVARYPEMVGIGYHSREPGILHRLDTGTSGLLVAARTQRAFEFLAASLRCGHMRKEYYLVCEGDGLADMGRIDIPIGIDPRKPRRAVACTHSEQMRRCNPRPAQTNYKVAARHDRFALVVAEASKAARHQIRVHFAAIGHPLVGDDLYGGNCQALQRHALHARLIAAPGCNDVAPFEVMSDLPEDMAALLRSR